MRKLRDYTVRQPGELVQLDTLVVRPLPGVVLKRFTARDVVSRWDVVRAYRSASAHTTTAFLDRLLDRTPFPVRAIQVDDGSEFQASFEQACAERGIRLFVLPPHSPELNGHVERAQRTHAEGFDDLYRGELDLNSINAALGEWERVFNIIRAYQSLDQRTPAEHLRQHVLGLAPPAQLSQMS